MFGETKSSKTLVVMKWEKCSKEIKLFLQPKMDKLLVLPKNLTNHFNSEK
jgi:hypothetical protein